MKRVANVAAIVRAKQAKKRSAPAVEVATANKNQLGGEGCTEVHGVGYPENHGAFSKKLPDSQGIISFPCVTTVFYLTEMIRNPLRSLRILSVLSVTSELNDTELTCR